MALSIPSSFSRKWHFSSEPAVPYTLQPFALAIWHATVPTAPAAAETNTFSPSLSSPILSKPTYAVIPGIPRVPKYACNGPMSGLTLLKEFALEEKYSLQPKLEFT